MHAEKFLTVENFCWRYDLKCGGLIIGYLELVLSLIGVGMSCGNFPSLRACIASTYFILFEE